MNTVKLLLVPAFIALAFFHSSISLGEVSKSELAEIEAYIDAVQIRGTWKENAIRTWIAWEDSGRKSIPLDNVRPQLTWMAEVMESVQDNGSYRESKCRLFATKVREILVGSKNSDGHSKDSISTEVISQLAASFVSLDPVINDPRNVLIRPTNQGFIKSMPLLFINEKDASRSHLTDKDFVELSPFTIEPLEIVRNPKLKYDGVWGTGRDFLQHDLNHGSGMTSGWMRDADYFDRKDLDEETSRDRLEGINEETRTKVRQARREIVKQVYESVPKYRTQLLDSVFTASHERASFLEELEKDEVFQMRLFAPHPTKPISFRKVEAASTAPKKTPFLKSCAAGLKALSNSIDRTIQWWLLEPL